MTVDHCQNFQRVSVLVMIHRAEILLKLLFEYILDLEVHHIVMDVLSFPVVQITLLLSIYIPVENQDRLHIYVLLSVYE